MSVHTSELVALPVGPRIVRAWLKTVINPLIAALQNESRLLSNRNFTWRAGSGAMLLIAPVRHHLEYTKWANCDQFISFFPDVAELCETHDRQAPELSSACKRLYELLIGSSEFVKAVVDAMDSDRLVLEPGQTREMFTKAHAPAAIVTMIAEYVVNGTGPLGGEYWTAPLWNSFREQFISFPTRGATFAAWEVVEHEAEDLLSTIAGLIPCLLQVRDSLSLTFDIPPNP